MIERFVKALCGHTATVYPAVAQFNEQ